MSESRTIVARDLEPTVRSLLRHELPDLWHGDPCDWRAVTMSEPAGAFPRREAVGWVAEVHGQVVGSAICGVVHQSNVVDVPRWYGRLGRLVRWLASGYPERAQRIELVDFIVAPEPFAATIERALLCRLVVELQRSWRRVPVVIPESHLAAQLCLRRASYKAIRVLRGHYGDEDGYLMAREPS